MADIVFVAIAFAFFGLAALYVLGCERIIGRESQPPAQSTGADADSAATAGATDPTRAEVSS